MMQDDGGPIVVEEHNSYSAGGTAVGDPHSPPPVAWRDPGAGAADAAGAADEPDTADEPGVSSVTEAEILSQIFAADAEPELAGASPAADAPEPGPAAASSAPMASTIPSAHWHEIQVMFVDDPRAAVEQAAALAGASAAALVMSVHERQQALMSAWQGDDAGTEELRIAFQDYHTFWKCLEMFPRSASVGGSFARRSICVNVTPQVHAAAACVAAPDLGGPYNRV
jgi:hypothetical protein